MKTSRQPRCFTLLEITIAVALLGIIATTMGWNLKGMIDTYRFRKSVSRFYHDVQKWQIMALSRRCDLTVTLSQKGQRWSYRMESPEPGLSMKKEITLQGTQTILCSGAFKNKIIVNVCSTGRIEPIMMLEFRCQDEAISARIDLTRPLLIKTVNL